MSDPFSIEDQVESGLIDVDENLTEEQKKAEREAKQLNEDLKAILKLPHGRNVLWHFMDKFGVFRETFCGESTNNSSYNQGRSSCGREIMQEILLCDPRAYVEMLNEKIKDSEK